MKKLIKPPWLFNLCAYLDLIKIKSELKMKTTTTKKLNIQKTKIMASGPFTSWQIDGETVETVADFIFRGSQHHCRW